MNDKKINIAIVIATLAIVGVIGVAIFGGQGNVKQDDLNQVIDAVNRLANSSQLGGITNYDQVGIGPVTQSAYTLTIAAGSATANVLTNNTERSLFIPDGILATNGTASSGIYAFVLFAQATTSTSVPVNMLFPGVGTVGIAGNIINGYKVGSTTASANTVAATSTVLSALNGNGQAQGGFFEGRTIELKRGESVLFWMTTNASSTAFCNNNGTGNALTSFCETATSTNRGLNPTLTLFLSATSTVSNPTLE